MTTAALKWSQSADGGEYQSSSRHSRQINKRPNQGTPDSPIMLMSSSPKTKVARCRLRTRASSSANWKRRPLPVANGGANRRAAATFPFLRPPHSKSSTKLSQITMRLIDNDPIINYQLLYLFFVFFDFFINLIFKFDFQFFQ